MSMVSVLIPVYNYPIASLVTELQKQFSALNTKFEILCLEDGSDEKNIKENSRIEAFPFTSHLISKTNNGRTKSRQMLCEKAKFEWLLFLDADVMPKNDRFISNYLELTSQNYQAIYGGISYENKAPRTEHLLRWKYGKSKEQVLASLRNQTPYKNIVSANFLIRKNAFHSINSKITENAYGYDNYFGALLKEKGLRIHHFDNEVFHLGLENNEVYLSKKKQAAETLLKLVKEHKINAHDNKLLSLFFYLKRYQLNHVFAFAYNRLHLVMKKNLLGKNASIRLLQFYRISYMCYYDLKTN